MPSTTSTQPQIHTHTHPPMIPLPLPNSPPPNSSFPCSLPTGGTGSSPCPYSPPTGGVDRADQGVWLPGAHSVGIRLPQLRDELPGVLPHPVRHRVKEQGCQAFQLCPAPNHHRRARVLYTLARFCYLKGFSTGVPDNRLNPGSPSTTTLGDRRLDVKIQTITIDFLMVSKIHDKLYIVFSCLATDAILCVGFHLPASVLLSHFYKGSWMKSTERRWNLHPIKSSLELVLLL